ncbi:MAG: alkaline phosphatase family protein [Candidatus Hydrogenedentes bacterium]|nr:alkaline phosphatase family protein [Candidatus Hydrogenedentota bacterium]
MRLGLTALLACCAAAALPAIAWAASGEEGAQPRVLVIVLDGCRPDYVTPEVMPNVFALGQRGIVCERNHAVYPTLTRVNASSFATGCYPARHGLMGNAVYFPEVEYGKGLSTGNAENLQRIDEHIGGTLLTVPSLGEILEQNGKELLVVSSGSSGSSFLLNHRAKGGGVINVDMVLPETNKARVDEAVGPVPEEAYPNAARNRWVVDAYIKLGLDEVRPDVTYMWLSDPDHTAHAHDMGSPTTVEALKTVDSEVGRIVDALESRGLTGTTDIIIASDHGFSVQTGEAKLAEFLVQKGLKGSLSSADVVVVDGCVYVDGHNEERIRAIVELLQATPWVGALFTKAKEPSSPEGVVGGTLSFDLIHFNHERSPDILVDANWSDAKNSFGWSGTTALPGVAGHGTSSPFDIHNLLIAAGPAFKEHATSDAPTGNVDIMPTVCALVGVEPAHAVDGRVLTELLRESPETASSQNFTKEISREGYALTLHATKLEDSTYLDYTQTMRNTFPGEHWETKRPADAGLDGPSLESLSTALGGRGCVIKGGYVVAAWGDQTERGDWMSSAKPVLSTLLFFAAEEGLVTSVDQLIVDFGWPLEGKDRGITFRHLGAMTSGYARPEGPGEAWAYNDFAIQLYQKTLFDRVFHGDPKSVAEDPRRLGALQFEDGLEFREDTRRLKASVRDFARIAWFWMNRGNWNGKQVLPSHYFEDFMQPQTPKDLPHTAKADTNDDLQIGSFGGESDHFTKFGAGIYGFNWWFNNTGRLHPDKATWPDAPGATIMSIGFGGNCSVLIPNRNLILVSAKGDWGRLDAGEPDNQMNRTIAALCNAVLDK